MGGGVLPARRCVAASSFRSRRLAFQFDGLLHGRTLPRPEPSSQVGRVGHAHGLWPQREQTGGLQDLLLQDDGRNHNRYRTICIAHASSSPFARKREALNFARRAANDFPFQKTPISPSAKHPRLVARSFHLIDASSNLATCHCRDLNPILEKGFHASQSYSYL